MTKRRDDLRIEPLRSILYFCGGAAIGLLIGLVIAIQFEKGARPGDGTWDWPFGLGGAVMLGLALLIGWISVRRGDAFWHWLRDNMRKPKDWKS